MADEDDNRHRLSVKIEDEEGGSPEGAVTVTIDGEAINEPQTDENNEGYVSFRVPTGTYEVVDIDAPEYTLDEEVVTDLENGPTVESIVLTDTGDE